ncbi:LysR family transcriptional regulator [Microbacterium sp. WCS2018Hpa-9]|uniref:LysR family transcriptional regulator n=1 Tax=Microbacterium sp. WCS2018Hpa-9 TaxID=3073635 RepID=UPI00288C3040|nr:LysR family transcriptional regulator [Microbacterium sp. WCS2018Hpa-9]
MDSQSLTYFVAVARLGSVTAAANSLHITQPAVSKKIAQLEHSLGAALFRRMHTGMALTASGATLFSISTSVLEALRRGEALMRSKHGQSSFVIACPPTTADLVIAPYMADLNPPVVDLRLTEAPDINHAIERDADLGVSSMRPPNDRASLCVADIPITVQRPGSWGDANPVDLDSLHDQWLIVPRTGVQPAVRERLSTPSRSWLMRDAATGTVAQALAAAGHGWALVTEPARFGLQSAPAHAAGQPLQISLYASWDRNHYAAPQLEELAVQLRGHIQDHVPWQAPHPRT